MFDTRKTLLMIISIMAISSPSFAQTYTISGTATDNLFGPVANVAVQMYDTTGIVIGIYSDSTDNAGFYSISGVDPGYYDISFRPRNSSGLVPLYIETIHITANTTYNVTLQPGIYLTGFVHDSQNQGILDIDLNVYDQATDYQLFTPRDNTDADGLYNIVIPTGIYRIAYRYRGNDQNARYVPQEFLNVPVNADTAIDVLMPEGFFITGTVLGPGGVPVFDADTDARDLATGLKVYTPNDNTDNNGHYLMLVSPGNYEVNVSPIPSSRLLPGIVYNSPVFSDVVINFNLIAGQLVSGTVRNPSSAGVFNVGIGVIDSVTGQDVFVPGNRTDSSGSYQFVLSNGTYFIEFSPRVVLPYLAGYWQDGFVVSGDTQLDVTVPWGYLVSGTMFNSFGVVVENADVDAIDIATDFSVPLSGDHTDSLGVYATVVAPGTYHLEFEPLRSRLLAAERFTNQSIFANTQFNVVLDTAMVVSGSITQQGGTPISDVRVSAVESVSGNEAFTPGNKSDLAGFYEILIRPETYDLTYSPDSLSGIPDTITYYDVGVTHDTLINVVYGLTPVANFIGNPLSGNAPLQVSFTDLSTNNPTTWSWVFGDGGTSAEQNPVYIYDNPGVYSVTLTVMNSSGSDAEAKTNYIEVIAAPPVADFVGSPRVGIPSLEVSFTDLSQNGPTAWLWEFGDGGSDNVQNPTYTYDGLGSYTVTLTATNGYGSDVEIKTEYILVSETGGCGPYVIGDYNGNESFNVADVISAFSKLQTGAPDAFLLCECPPGSGNTWAVAMDVNASCGFNIADVIAGFSKLQTGSPELVSCSNCPPGSPSPRRGNDIR